MPLLPSFRSPGSAYVEGDASSASYFLAGAAVTGGTITVEGCGTTSLQVCVFRNFYLFIYLFLELESIGSATFIKLAVLIFSTRSISHYPLVFIDLL